MTQTGKLSFQQGLTEIERKINCSQKPVLIVVCGGSCSGKTYFTEELRKRILMTFGQPAVAPLDFYFKDLDDLTMPRNEEGRRLFDVPGAYMTEDYVYDIGMLLSGKTVRLPSYDFKASKRLAESGDSVGPSRIIIAEGLFTLELLSGIHSGTIKVYVDADFDTRLSRRIARDTVRYNVSEEVVITNFMNKVEKCHRQYVEPQKLLADMILCN